MIDMQTLLENAKSAKPQAAALPAGEHNKLLESMALALENAKPAIIAANKKDLENAKGKIADVMLDRLLLNDARIDAMAGGIRAVAALESPLGMCEKEYNHPNGMQIKKTRVPMGVIAIIYESRPNVTSDAAALCIKSGNVCVLRGGSDAINTNRAVVAALRSALAQHGEGCRNLVQLVDDTTRQSAQALMQARGYVDLLIPRGGAGLISAVVEGARGVPVIETGTGICHVYVDKDAELDMALSIIYNAKTSRPSVCNSAEVCLVHRDAAEKFLPMLQNKMAGQVQLRLDASAAGFIDGMPACENDFDTEFLDYILAVGVVNSLQDAVRHINTHSTGHSDAIVTANSAAAKTFLTGVDSAAVYHNASTRFTDGGEFGLGCEMGISTQKLGARGPMGLYELTSYKYVIEGSGQTR